MNSTRAAGDLAHDTTVVRRSSALRAQALDLVLEIGNHAAGAYRSLDRLAATLPIHRILIVGVYERESNAPHAVRELRRSRHELRWALGSRSASAHPDLCSETVAVGLDGGLFDNTNLLLAAAAEESYRPRWIIRVDSDVLFPRRWLDRFITLCDVFDLALAGPAYTRRSTVSYALTRRSARWLVRETEFVPAGAVVAFREDVACELLPFPDGIGQGWGLDMHWAHLALRREWRLGLVDVPPVRHETQVGETYDAHREAARGTEWLRNHPHRSIDEAAHVIARHRRMPRP
jgi:hypothetical protein